MIKTTTILLGSLLLVASAVLPISPVLAEGEILTIEGARIRGNQELPTVLYVVPWQAPEIQSLDAPQTSFAITQPLEPLERSQFQRLVSYHEYFQERQVEQSYTDREQQ